MIKIPIFSIVLIKGHPVMRPGSWIFLITLIIWTPNFKKNKITTTIVFSYIQPETQNQYNNPFT